MDNNAVLTHPDLLQAVPLLLEHSCEMIVLVDVQGNVEYVNQAFVLHTGYAKEEVTGRNLSALQAGHPLAFPPGFFTTSTQNTIWQGESSATKKTGELYRQLNQIIPIRDPAGTIQRFLVSMEESTGWKGAEENLKERLLFEELLSCLSARFVNLSADQVDAAIQNALHQLLVFFQVDRCGLVQIMHEEKAWQVTHLAVADNIPPLPVGVDLPFTIHPWTYDTIVRRCQVVAYSKLEELPPEACTDKRTWMEWGIRSNLIIPLTVGGPVDYVISINAVNSECVWPQELVPRLRLLGEMLVNALKRCKADQALLASEKRLLLAASAAEAGLWMLNTDTGHIWVTPMVRELFDLPEHGELIVEDFMTVIHPDDRAKVQAMIGTGLETGKVDNIEYRVLRPDNSIRWIVSRSQFSASTPGHPPSLMGASIDISPRKAMEARIKEQVKEINRLKLRLEAENKYLRDEVRAERGSGTIVGSSDVLQYVLFRARQVAPTDATVLILGETGTGKGLVANAIHEMSPRHQKPMITVNCAALPGNLIESELFGREKGAFTGAHARQPGRFELADGGTIFLDEIGEMPLALQVKLLRVLQDGEFERLGGLRTIKVDVRVIAATSRDLKADAATGQFREDLYYRLHVFPLSLPPLRTRTDDIPQLAQYFIKRYAKKFFKRFDTIAKETMNMLVSYNWPGNVRELEHIIERGVITSAEPEFRIAEAIEGEARIAQPTAPLPDFNAMARTHVLRVLEQTNWKIEGKGGAAETLGLHPSTLRFRIKKLAIKRP